MSNWVEIPMVKDRESYENALKTIEDLMEKPKLKLAEQVKLDLLAMMVEEYEEKHFPMGGKKP